MNGDQRRGRRNARRLPSSHPAFDLVSQRAFEDLREEDLAPRPNRQSRPSGSGRVSVYPTWTRAQVARVLKLRDRAIKDEGELRILLWLDGFPIPTARIEEDITQRVTAITTYARSLGPTAADQMVMRMVKSERPTPLVRWARGHIPDPQLLEDAFVQMSQVGLGVRPADLMLDEQSARPLHTILDRMCPGVLGDVAQLVEVFDDPDFNEFSAEAGSAARWTMADWCRARDAQMSIPFQPPDEVRGEDYFGYRFSLLIAAGAAVRHAQRKAEEGSDRSNTVDPGSQEAC